MKKFRYRAKNGMAEVVEGALVAENQDDVVAKINDMGLVPVSVEEESPATAAAAAATAPINSNTKVKSHLVTLFYEQIARLLRSGIPLLPALVIVKDQMEDVSFIAVLEDLKNQMREGQSFTKSLAQYPRVFPLFDQAVAEAGEHAGHLDESLSQLAKYREEEEILAGKIKNAMIYPAFIMFLGFFAVIFLLTFVIPKFTVLFQSLGQELPLLTRLLIGFSQGMQRFGPWVALALVIGLLVFKQSLRNMDARRAWDTFMIKLPKAGRWVLLSQLVRICHTLQLLLHSGIPLLPAIRMSVTAVENLAVRKDLEEALVSVEEGSTMGEALKRSSLVPKFMMHLIRIGEESGKMEDALSDIADWYEKEIASTADILLRFLEPMLILVVGLMLGLIIIAVLLPVFSLNAAIS